MINLIKILILTANPNNTGSAPLGLDAEVRRIEEALRRSRHRDHFQLTTKLAIRTTDLQRALLDHRPQIVHFSGHGLGEQGLVLENDAGNVQLVSTEALEKLFGIFETGRIECVLFNACYSEVQAKAIHRFIDCVIGMNQPIGDRPAVQFAEAFYDALGAGSYYEEAYKIGCSAIALSGSSDDTKPVLYLRKRPSSSLPKDLATHQVAQRPSASAAIAEPIGQASQSQSIGNISMSGSNNPFNAIQAAGHVNLSQTSSQPLDDYHDLQAILNALGQLKQAIKATAELDETEKEMAEVPIKKLETELQKSQPNKSVLDRTVAVLKRALDTVSTLAEPVAKVVALIAKVE